VFLREILTELRGMCQHRLDLAQTAGDNEPNVSPKVTAAAASWELAAAAAAAAGIAYT